MTPYFFSFDVESIGLFGEGFAVAFCVVDPEGEEVDSALYTAKPELSPGLPADREWVKEHVLPALAVYVPKRGASLARSVHEIRKMFWDDWRMWHSYGARMVAENPYPVEARFLFDCIADDRERAKQAPYPLIDVSSVRLAAGFDPIATCERLPIELPVHNPLSDARQSARLLIEALRRIDSMMENGS